VRWYRQTAASFYAPWLYTTSPQYVDVSSDERLGAFHALTYGLKYAAKLGGDLGSELSVRLEYYQQLADQKRPTPVGLQGLDLYPGLRATMLQVGYSFGY